MDRKHRGGSYWGKGIVKGKRCALAVFFVRVTRTISFVGGKGYQVG